MRRICVFCGANSGTRSEYAAAAQQLGALLAQRGLELVYGAGRTGLMGVLAEATLAAGGKVIGVVPEALNTQQLVHPALSRLKVVADLARRKALMADLSDGFIALPGGLGTLDELLEATTAAQLGFHQKPVGALNLAGFFDSLCRQLGRAVSEGFLPAPHRHLLVVETDPATLLDRFGAGAAPR
jgi:uncharacterized protein (TIGR00730 family)